MSKCQVFKVGDLVSIVDSDRYQPAVTQGRVIMVRAKRVEVLTDHGTLEFSPRSNGQWRQVQHRSALLIDEGKVK